jgi:hypothetical protein
MISVFPLPLVRMMNRIKRSIAYLITGIAISLLPALLLLWSYAWSLVPPGPGYYARKLRFMLSMPDPGCGTWLGILGLIPGLVLIGMGIAVLFRPEKVNTLRDPPQETSGYRE